MKEDLKPDHIPLSNFQLLVIGTAVPAFTFVTTSSIEEELQTVELPDQTVASGGRTLPTEFTGTLPMHHTIERLAMETWYEEGKDPVDPNYRKEATILFQSISRLRVVAYSLKGLFVSKRVIPEGNMEASGDLANVEYTFKVQEVLPLS